MMTSIRYNTTLGSAYATYSHQKQPQETPTMGLNLVWFRLSGTILAWLILKAKYYPSIGSRVEKKLHKRRFMKLRLFGLVVRIFITMQPPQQFIYSLWKMITITAFLFALG